MAGSESREQNGTSDYCANLDFLRLLAVAAVVWIHAVESPALKAGIVWCRFAVPAFTATSVLLLVWRHREDSAPVLRGYVGRRVARIYLLFLAWNCFYAAARWLEHTVSQGRDEIRWKVETLLVSGFTEQLWFLPFLAVVTLVVAALIFVSARAGFKTGPWVIGLSILGIVLALLPPPIEIHLETHPASYWFVLSWLAFPSALMAFGLLPFCDHGKANRKRPGLALMLVFMAGLLLWISRSGHCSNLLQNSAGVILVLGAVLGSCPDWLKRNLKKIGALALPVYLLHPLFVHALQVVGHRGAHLPVAVAFDGLVVFVGLVGSGVTAWFLQKIPYLKWLVTVR